MSRIPSRAALTLMLMLGAAGCDEEPMSPALASVATEEASVNVTGADRSAIREIVQTLDEAWTAGDPVRYAAQYANVTDFVSPNGVVLTDPDAITALYTALFNFVFPNTTRRSSIRNLTFLSARIAVVDIDARVRDFESLPPGFVPWRPRVVRALEKNVLLKRAGEWRIVQHQQTLVAPE